MKIKETKFIFRHREFIFLNRPSWTATGSSFSSSRPNCWCLIRHETNKVAAAQWESSARLSSPWCARPRKTAACWSKRASREKEKEPQSHFPVYHQWRRLHEDIKRSESPSLPKTQSGWLFGYKATFYFKARSNNEEWRALCPPFSHGASAKTAVCLEVFILLQDSPTAWWTWWIRPFAQMCFLDGFIGRGGAATGQPELECELQEKFVTVKPGMWEKEKKKSPRGFAILNKVKLTFLKTTTGSLKYYSYNIPLAYDISITLAVIANKKRHLPNHTHFTLFWLLNSASHHRNKI